MNNLLNLLLAPLKALLANYLKNLSLWKAGWGRFGEITDWKPGWGPEDWRWKATYGVNYLLCCLVLAGAVEPMSAFMHRHRRGWLNDKVLDVIEVADPKHGEKAGAALWGSVECGLALRITIPIAWVLIVWNVIKLVRWVL